MAAILGPGGPSTAAYFAADGPGDIFWGTMCGMTVPVDMVPQLTSQHTTRQNNKST